MTLCKTDWFSFLHLNCQKHLALSYPQVNAEWEDWEMNYDMTLFISHSERAELAGYVSSPFLLFTTFCFWVAAVGTVSKKVFVNASLTTPGCLRSYYQPSKSMFWIHPPEYLPAVCLSFSRAFATVFSSTIIDKLMKHPIGKWVQEVSELKGLKGLWLTAKPV